MQRFIAITILAVLMVAGRGSAALAACGGVTIGEMNWDSSQVIANVEKFILEAGYGCQVRLVQTTTIPCLTSMIEKGEPDIASEIWINNVKDVLERGVDDGRVVIAGSVLSDGGVEAWWIPAYVAEAHPKIKTIQDVIANAKLFSDPENPSKGRFYNCPAGWACKTINDNLFRAYGMGEAFTNFNPGSAEGLAGAIAKAYERQEPWFGYYWAPTAILGKYPMVQVELGDFDAEGHACNTKSDCAKPHAGRYPPSRVVAVTTKDFSENHKKELAFIQKLAIPNDVMNAVLAWGEDHRAEGNEMAGFFMLTYEKLWSSWLPSDMATKVKKALQR